MSRGPQAGVVAEGIEWAFTSGHHHEHREGSKRHERIGHQVIEDTAGP